jgi:thymidylate kinase
MIIAFMGNDGSGKTSIAKELHKFFKEVGMDVYYKHEYDYALLKYFLRLMGKKNLLRTRKEMIVDKKNV